MIAKHVAMTAARKSDFLGLVGYITNPQGNQERLGMVSVANCHSDDLKSAALEILNTQALNTRSSGDKTYHLIVSFRAGEKPPDGTLKAIEDRLCSGIGFKDHQRVSVLHQDTDNLHLHIAINKIHPTRFTIHEPFNAYHTLSLLCTKLEVEYGLEQDNHKARKDRSENQADDMEHHASVESLLGWLKRECHQQMLGAQSWTALHKIMREHGLRLHDRANGLVITSHTGISVKASSVGRELSKAKLEAQLGAYRVDGISNTAANPIKTYGKRPIGFGAESNELYAFYASARQTATDTRAEDWRQAKQRKDRLVQSAKRSGRLKRALIMLTGSDGVSKRLAYAAVSKNLHDQLSTIAGHYRQEKAAIFEKHRRPSWPDWLREQASHGNDVALQILQAKALARVGPRQATENHTGTDDPVEGPWGGSVTKNGMTTYRIGATSVRDDGQAIRLSHGADAAGVDAALRIAMARYGERLSVKGSAEFKQRIVSAAVAARLPIQFDDESLERQRRELMVAVNTKEIDHENATRDRSASHGRRSNTGRPGSDQRTAASGASIETEGRRNSGSAPGAHSDQSDAGGAGTSTSPADRHGLPGLPKRGVVHDSARSQVLLPGNVLGYLEHKGEESDYGVRRDLRRTVDSQASSLTSGEAATSFGFAGRAAADQAARPRICPVGAGPPPASKDRLRLLTELTTIALGPQPDYAARPTAGQFAGVSHANAIEPRRASSPGERAVAKYLTEREQERFKDPDISKHTAYIFSEVRTAKFAGIRQVDGQTLALLATEEVVMVMPVTDAMAERLSRLAMGHPLQLTSRGIKPMKGQTR